MFRMALRVLRWRKGSFIASFIALFFGAMLVLACGGLMETGIRLAVAPERLAAASIVVTGKENGSERKRLPASLIAKIQSVDGVSQALPEVSFPVQLLRDGRPFGDLSQGHGASSIALGGYTLQEGALPKNTQEIVIDQKTAQDWHLTSGDTIRVAVRDGLQQYTVTGITNGSGLYFSDVQASKLLGQNGRVDNIGVIAAPGVDAAALEKRLDQTLQGDNVRTLRGDERGAAEYTNAAAAQESLIVIAGVFGGLVTMVAIFVVGSTLGLLIQQRKREMALLKAVGATPGQLRRMILGETFVVTIFAAVLACLPGYYAGAFLVDWLIASGVAPAGLIYKAGIIPIASAIAIVFIAATVAALVASRNATRVRPTEALAESMQQQRWFNWFRLVLALVCFGGALALGLVTMLVMNGPLAASTSGPSSILWAVTLALIAPALTVILIALLQWPIRLAAGLPGFLAVLNARSRRLRFAAAVMPIMLATGIATSMLYQQAALGRASFEAYSRNLQADTVLSSSTGFTPDFVTTVAAQPGVAGASGFVTSTGSLIPDKLDEDGDTDLSNDVLQGVSGAGVDQVFDYAVPSGSLKDLKGNTVALPTVFANRMNKPVGSEVRLMFGDGTEATLKVVAHFEAPKGYETVLVPAELLIAHTTDAIIPHILVRTKPDINQAQFAATLTSLAPIGLTISDREALDRSFAEQEKTGAWINYMLSGMIIGYTVISLANTLIVATAERKREFAVQRMVGSTKGQVMRMMLAESLLTALAGLTLGGVVALLTLIPFNVALSGSVWPEGPVVIYLVVAVVAILLTLLATLLPAWLALRTRPIEAAAGRE